MTYQEEEISEEVEERLWNPMVQELFMNYFIYSLSVTIVITVMVIISLSTKKRSRVE
ncbi:hypothetical protein ACFSYB_19440 [Litchfieldia salsa]